MTKYRRYWVWMAVALIVIDYCAVGFFNNEYVRKEKALIKTNKISSIIMEDKEIFRLYSPSYSIPQYTAALYDFELSDGVDPFQISDYRDFMEQATGIDVHGYSVSIPPFRTGKPEVDNIKAQPDGTYLGILNVKYIISAYEVFGDGLILIEEFPEGYLYLNEYYLPRAWVMSRDISDEILPDFSNINQVENIKKMQNTIMIQANGPGRLMLSEVAYPGWSAKINDEPVSISTAYNIIQTVWLPPGNNQIEFKFYPASLNAGLILGLFGWGYCAYKIYKQDDKSLSM